MEQFNLLTTRGVGKEVERIKLAFEKKHELEKKIACMIKTYEDETGLAIDMIKYQRDITLPIRGSRYTALTIIITSEEIT
jgi:hypothetical protein